LLNPFLSTDGGLSIDKPDTEIFNLCRTTRTPLTVSHPLFNPVKTVFLGVEADAVTVISSSSVFDNSSECFVSGTSSGVVCVAHFLAKTLVD
jgi:hypothetical protein